MYWTPRGGGLSRGSVASFLLLGGGGGQDPQMYRQEKLNHVYVTYMRERAKRASASEIYAFSGLKTHLHVHGIINDSMTDKTLTLRKSMNMRASLENVCIYLL